MTREMDVTRIADELTAIKRLLIVALLENGMSQRGVAKALGVNQSSISRMFTTGGSRKGSKGARSTANAEEDDGSQPG